jgi:peptide/nickel transport system ATP-binding protein
MNNGVLLEIKHLKTYFYLDEGIARAVDDVSLTLGKGDTLGLVGESGSGKSVTALSIMRLIQDPPGKVVGGSIWFAGRGDLTQAEEAEMRQIRGKDISMIFQEPMTSLNPIFRVGSQIAESIKYHQDTSRKEAFIRAIEMLKVVRIPSPEKRAYDYPHEMSGGMRQRVMIAMALACNPKLMLADEPTTSLDVTIQSQILNLMNKLKEEIGTSILLITHDLGVVAEMCQKVCVMYAGVIVEYADVRTLFREPLHPYTIGLLRSIPRLNYGSGEKKRLVTIPGVVPSAIDLPQGCRFRDRCSHAYDPCKREEPLLASASNSPENAHLVRCWLHLPASED